MKVVSPHQHEDASRTAPKWTTDSDERIVPDRVLGALMQNEGAHPRDKDRGGHRDTEPPIQRRLVVSRAEHRDRVDQPLAFRQRADGAWELPEGSVLRAPSLVFSTRSRWRRVLSTVYVRTLAGLLRRSPVLRLELHPTDADHPGVRRCWMRVLEKALRHREPVRLGQVADALRGAGSDHRPQRA